MRKNSFLQTTLLIIVVLVGTYIFGNGLIVIEDKVLVVNETVDISDIQEQILELEKQLAIIEAKINFTQAEGI